MVRAYSSKLSVSTKALDSPLATIPMRVVVRRKQRLVGCVPSIVLSLPTT